jgi:hypothetical protein
MPSGDESPIELGGWTGVGSICNRRARLSPAFVKVLCRRIRVMRSILHRPRRGLGQVVPCPAAGGRSGVSIARPIPRPIGSASPIGPDKETTVRGAPLPASLGVAFRRSHLRVSCSAPRRATAALAAAIPRHSERRRRARVRSDALGHAASSADRRPARDQHSQYLFATLARLAEARKSLPGPFQQLRGIRAGAEPGD